MVVGRAFFVVRGVLIFPVGIVVVCRWLIWGIWVLWVERVCLGNCLWDLLMFLVFFLDVCLLFVVLMRLNFLGFGSCVV